MGRIITGLLLIVAGSLIIFYHNQLYKLFGDIARAERNLGESRVVYVLFGCLIIVIGVLLLFGIGGSNPTDVQSVQFGA